MKHIRYFHILLLIAVFCWSSFAGLEAQGDQGSYQAGEKIFSELSNAEGKSCADCHYFKEADTINWNPSAMELSGRLDIYRSKGLGDYFNSPSGELLKEAHAEITLNGEQESELIAYLEHLQNNPYIPSVPTRWRMFLFLGMFVLMIILWVEKRRLRKLPKVVRWIFIPAAWAVVVVILVQDAIAVNRSKDYAPFQPVKFSHLVHAKDNKIDCNYCHPGVLKGKNAGVPPINLCMNCHKHQTEGTRTGLFEIRKVIQAAEDSAAIRWIRIHNLPDFTYFNHMQHVEIGGIDCITCHGDVENMHLVRQVEDLSMGWCIKCHDDTKVDFSNDYYKTYYPALADSLITGKIDSIMVSDLNGMECSVCHY